MIVSFADKSTEALWVNGSDKKIPAELHRRVLGKLAQLSNAQSLQDLRQPPSNHLEALSGDRKGQHSIRVNKKYRLCFRWANGAHAVEFTDYH